MESFELKTVLFYTNLLFSKLFSNYVGASQQGELKITENNNCPFCNPKRRIDVETKLNACEKHKWVSKAWYENRFKNE
ncbi:MAG: hypothetical protein GH150_07405 [Hadesarchaea archaeon]|nr:hypothetical protein [Hadesarchaea archaeon]